ncbi:MAG: hypothetical protein E6K45_10030 [Gammaproteobacteria bacterium]|nr:MAG: hypothetical protein E6K45_10030 [Gammaproteobacteria bacterium]
MRRNSALQSTNERPDDPHRGHSRESLCLAGPRHIPAAREPAEHRPRVRVRWAASGFRHARYVTCTKSFDGRRPKSVYRLTAAGRAALNRCLDHVEAVIKATRRG